MAKNIYTETHEADNDAEILSFQERLKKELQRDTTKPERLRKYLEIISNHPDAERLDTALNKNIPLGFISESISKGMRLISKEVDKNL